MNVAKGRPVAHRWSRAASAARLGMVLLLLAALGCAANPRRPASTSVPPQSVDAAVNAYTRGDCRESIRLFSAALRGQEYPVLLNGLGMAQLQCRQPQNAVDSLQRAVSLSPDSAALHTNLATALFALGEYRKAEREFDAALRLDSVNPEALVGKAGILLRKKQPEKALKLLSQVSGNEAAAPETLYDRALALYQMGLAADAESILQRYADAYPHDAEAQNALGVVALGLKKPDQAKAHLDRAIALMPEQGIYYYNRGAALKAKKNFPAAVEDYSRAIAFMPELAEAYVDRGDLRLLLREAEAGCKDLKEACDLGQCERFRKFQEAGRCRAEFWQ